VVQCIGGVNNVGMWHARDYQSRKTRTGNNMMKVIPAEQRVYDDLKKMSTGDLIKYAQRRQIEIHNRERCVSMARNILMLRGEDADKTKVFLEPNRFMEETWI
jgi:hypothetical protein